jgi:hypothetical protein
VIVEVDGLLLKTKWWSEAVEGFFKAAEAKGGLAHLFRDAFA